MQPKVLTVDDSKTIRLVVTKVLKPYECDIVEAANGVEGLAAASREKPDLIILDITMPVMDGVEMLTKLKSDSELRSIPVMMLTAESGRENVLHIAKLGIRDYLVKPFKEDQLLDKVSRIINLKSRGVGKTKVKTLSDPATILVVDDKPAIVQQLAEGLKSTPWTIVGKSTAAETLEEVNKAVPDVIMLSLSLPDNGGFNLFNQLRGMQNTRSVPILGMCVKTDADAQGRAEQSGFAGIVTKPIDVEALAWKLARVMNLDTSSRYFSLKEDMQVLTLPSKVTQQVTSDIERYLQNKMNKMVDSGMSKFLVDLSQVTEVDVSLIKMIITTVQNCHELSIRVRLVATPELGSELKSFKETSTMTIDRSIDEAKVLFDSMTK